MGSKYLCLSCGEIYSSEYLRIDEYADFAFCPKSNCIGKIVEVDELLLPTIKILNEKGYTTKYCCSGHWSGQLPNGYIMFDEGIDVPNLPKGFIREVSGIDSITIRSDMARRKPTLNDFKKICDNAKVLVDWADNLPQFDE